MNKWSHLPNAQLIDWVLESLKTQTKTWGMAWDAYRNTTRSAARDAARDAAHNAAWYAGRRAVLNAGYDAARDTGWDVILVLVAYDDCDQYLQMTYDQLLTYAILSERPQAVLLLPLKWVQEHETLVTLT